MESRNNETYTYTQSVAAENSELQGWKVGENKIKTDRTY